MFAQAYKHCTRFTRPLVTSVLRASGTCDAAIGTFVFVNKDGWVLTAAHMLGYALDLANKKKAYLEDDAKRRSIDLDSTLNANKKRAKMHALGKQKPDAVADLSLWWAADAARIERSYIVPGADLALIKLSGIDPAEITDVPTFKDPAKEMMPGTSLCRLGYPFSNLQPTHNGTAFALPDEVYTMPRFPIEGIFTRTMLVGTHAQGYKIAFIETSSPGLKGQSGGPIFDKEGTIWGIQSMTQHLALGFSPQVPNGKAGEVEHQFLNIGCGAHPETIVGLLREHGVSFNLSTY